jgi:hypothetical protein
VKIIAMSEEYQGMQQLNLWVNGDKVILISCEKLRQNCEDIIGGEATLE